MKRKIIGVTVGTSISPEALKKKMNIDSSSGGNAVLYTEQNLTDEQKAQARGNIGAATVAEVLEQIPSSDREAIGELIETITIEEDSVTGITRIFDHQYTRLIIRTTMKKASASQSLRLIVNGSEYVGGISNGISASWDSCSLYLLIVDKALGKIYSFMSQHTNSFGNSAKPDWTVKDFPTYANIASMNLYVTAGELLKGSTIEIYGVRANA